MRLDTGMKMPQKNDIQKNLWKKKNPCSRVRKPNCGEPHCKWIPGTGCVYKDLPPPQLPPRDHRRMEYLTFPQLPPRDPRRMEYLTPQEIPWRGPVRKIQSQSPQGAFFAQIQRGKSLRKTKSPRRKSPPKRDILFGQIHRGKSLRKTSGPRRKSLKREPILGQIHRGKSLRKTSGPRARSPNKIRISKKDYYGRDIPDVPINLLSAIGGGKRLRKISPRKKRLTDRQKAQKSLGYTIDKYKKSYLQGQQQAGSWSPVRQRKMPFQFVGASKVHQKKSPKKSPKKTTSRKKPQLPLRPQQKKRREEQRRQMIAFKQKKDELIKDRRRYSSQDSKEGSWSGSS